MPKLLTIGQGKKFKAKKIEGGVNLTPPPSRLLGLKILIIMIIIKQIIQMKIKHLDGIVFISHCVLSAKCDCPSGIEGKCNHVCATLFALDFMYGKKATLPENKDDSSCTSNPCKWSVPPKQKGGVTPFHTVSFKKNDYVKLNKRVKVMDSNSEDNHGEWSNGRLQSIFSKLRKLEKDEDGVKFCHKKSQLNRLLKMLIFRSKLLY